MTQTRVFAIHRMTCPDCVRHVVRALASISGIRVADVNIGSRTVGCDPEKVLEQSVLDVLREAGCQATANGA
jgi:copper chaperone CopZ